MFISDETYLGDKARIVCSYKGLAEAVQVGTLIYIGDRQLKCEVTEITDVSNSERTPLIR